MSFHLFHFHYYSNLAVLHTFTGSDEAWFYLVSIAIEATGAPALNHLIKIMESMVSREFDEMIHHLTGLSAVIKKITDVLIRMYEKCDPHVFYLRVRRFLTGWENADKLPDGLLYEGVDALDSDLPESTTSISRDLLDEYSSKSINGQVPWKFLNGVYTKTNIHHLNDKLGSFRKYAGGSAGQSSLIHSLDVGLGIEHHPTKSTPRRNNDLVSNSRDNSTISSSTSKILSDSSNNKNPSEEISAVDFANTLKLNIISTSISSSPSIVSPTSSSSSSSSLSSPPPKPTVNFITEMRRYMPHLHREFIKDLSNAPSIRQFVQSISSLDEPQLNFTLKMTLDQRNTITKLFNESVNGMKLFRDRHIQMVTLYIVLQAKKKMGSSDTNQSVSRENMGMVARGTGGTEVLPFLKQSRDETKSAEI